MSTPTNARSTVLGDLIADIEAADCSESKKALGRRRVRAVEAAALEHGLSDTDEMGVYTYLRAWWSMVSDPGANVAKATRAAGVTNRMQPWLQKLGLSSVGGNGQRRQVPKAWRRPVPSAGPADEADGTDGDVSTQGGAVALQSTAKGD